MESENQNELPAPAPRPGTLGPLSPPLFNLALFALTLASAFVASLNLEEAAPEGDKLVPALLRAAAFSSALLLIMLVHEMGHFFAARRHKVDASWPYFMPAPIFSFVGTMGAFIRRRSQPTNRNAAVDISAAGPIAGFVITVPILWWGMQLSRVVPTPGAMEGWTLWDTLVSWARTGEAPDMRDAITFGEPLLLQLLERQRFGVLAQNLDVALHPLALAGWFGLFLVSVNLLPFGELDGGSLLYAISPRLHRFLGPPLAAGLVALGIFSPCFIWLLFGLFFGTILSSHRPLRDPMVPLKPARVAVAALSLIIFVVSFSPVPLGFLRA
jgi:membrane-associated protease RseP (regulator of RpoE activity)